MPSCETENDSEFAFSVLTVVTSAWGLDSEASSQMANARDDFCEYSELAEPLEVRVASGHRLPDREVGIVRVSANGSATVKMAHVRYVPNLGRKLLSIPALSSKFMTIILLNAGFHGSHSVSRVAISDGHNKTVFQGFNR
ncbi:hypothetical protein ON010_g8822 [Phytophthora cinnamomi]|nr:hypothetical protein ON010_g8822 [Phytophthora cinnamomi]